MKKIFYIIIFISLSCLSFSQTSLIKYLDKVDSIVEAIRTNASLKEKVTGGLLEKDKIKGALNIVAFFDQNTNQVHRIIYDKQLEYYERCKFYFVNGKLIFASYEKGDIKTKTKLVDSQYYYDGKKIISIHGDNASKRTGKELIVVANRLRKDFFNP